MGTALGVSVPCNGRMGQKRAVHRWEGERERRKLHTGDNVPTLRDFLLFSPYSALDPSLWDDASYTPGSSAFP